MFDFFADKNLIKIPKLDPKKSRSITTAFNYVWFGPEIPDTKEYPYLTNLINTAKKFGKTHAIKLWISGKYYANGDVNKRENLETLCKEYKIKIVDIDSSKYQNLPNRNLAYKLIETKMNPQFNPDKKMENYVAAADVIKAAVTYEYGGYTIAFDLPPKKIIEKKAKYGILLDCDNNIPIHFLTACPKHESHITTLLQKYNRDENIPTTKASSRFHFLAACPKHELFYITTLLQKYNLEYIFNAKESTAANNVLWQLYRKDNLFTYHSLTTMITGHVIPQAVEILKKIDPNWNKIINDQQDFLQNIAIFIPEYFSVNNKYFWAEGLKGDCLRDLMPTKMSFPPKLEKNAEHRFQQETGIDLNPLKNSSTFQQQFSTK